MPLPYGHSLSWTDEKELKYGPNRTLTAKIWIPGQPDSQLDKLWNTVSPIRNTANNTFICGDPRKSTRVKNRRTDNRRTDHPWYDSLVICLCSLYTAQPEHGPLAVRRRSMAFTILWFAKRFAPKTQIWDAKSFAGPNTSMMYFLVIVSNEHSLISTIPKINIHLFVKIH